MIVLIGAAAWYTLLFACAGRLAWPAAWANLAISCAFFLFNRWFLARKNPELLAQRWRKRTDVKRFDRVLRAVFLPVGFALPVLAGLGTRWNWTALPPCSAWFGAALLLLGHVQVTWAMAVNPHLEAMVRIQNDRGHRVITTGPYRFVRHPMYVGLLFQQAGHAAMYARLAAFISVAGTILALVIRTALEDRTLQAELPGYREYARHTRYRLVPRVW